MSSYSAAVLIALFSLLEIISAQSSGSSLSKCNPALRQDCGTVTIDRKISVSSSTSSSPSSILGRRIIQSDDKRPQPTYIPATTRPTSPPVSSHETENVALEDLRIAVSRMDEIMRIYFSRLEDKLTTLHLSIHYINQTLQNIIDVDGDSTSRRGSTRPFGGPRGNEKMSCGQLMEQTEENEFRVVCYFINWGSDRKQEGIHLPEDLDVNLCTHVNYAYASLDSNKLLIKEGNAWVDIDNRFYERVTSRKLKNPRLKVLLSLGGWSDSAGDKYSRLVRNSTARRLFKDHAIAFLRGHNFDGLNIQWQYPSCWQFDCDNSPREDRQNFVQWIQELKEAFDRQRPRLMLTVSVSPNSWVVSHAYDVPALARAVDYINVMTYDYHGDWDSKTGHPAPLYYSDGSNEEVPLNVNASMHYWVKRGAPAKKLVMEIQTYGRSFTLSDSRQTGMNAPARSGGRAGEISDEKGKLAYYEICQRIKTQSWIKKTDSLAGTYAYRGDQWVGYDDPTSIAKKARYVKDNKFGGIAIWDTSMDDFKPMCCRVANPILNVVSSVIRGHGVEPKDVGCE